jgi:hypothetical protein
MTAEASSGDRMNGDDPSKLTTQLVDRAIGAFREVMETRLAGMDRATELVARDVQTARADTDVAQQRMQEITAKDIGALRELIGARIDGIDVATRLLAATVDTLPTDVDRAVQSATSLIQAQLRNVQDVANEKFLAIDGTFSGNALALTAALAAQKEAAAEAKKSSDLAIAKSEEGTKETISANASQTESQLSGLASNVQDIKERVVRIESMGVGAAGSRTERRLDTGMNLTAASVLIGFLILAVALYAALHR